VFRKKTATCIFLQNSKLPGIVDRIPPVIDTKVTGRESRFLPTPLAVEAPTMGLAVGILPQCSGTQKLEWCGYPMVKKN